MTFWIGVSLGFGIGSALLTLLMLFLIGKVISGREQTSAETSAYCKLSLEQQAEQVGMLERIAMCLETKLIMED